jgi:CHAT domain-containing protein
VGTVVASLWQVDDDATGELMERFYTRHFAAQNAVSAARALRQAQLDLLSDPKRSDPYFWAAWMLMGKP